MRRVGRAFTAAAMATIAGLGAASAAASEAETQAMRAVRLTTDPTVVRACARVASARDDSVKDLRRKIVRSGGNAALLVFGVDDLSMIYADVYRCPATAPSGVPPPPAGTPPPPPPR